MTDDPGVRRVRRLLLVSRRLLLVSRRLLLVWHGHVRLYNDLSPTLSTPKH